ncbi:flagellar basal body rod protein FlgB [Phreatobacter stygius]|uniref:Flagellar basal body rod protein FlgB n=1 Tax=Phreatobacter stygius TaxID=1940610 RepID=A0A4D7B4N4_9HYPH|nr:flagellar basal body rod protein FlgB [Phreatobacter stygius]QCI62987.1 flagellar basal body rod protein FlgB [Phreatobacter stygius]
MAAADIPIFSMLRDRMRWHQDRQKLLAENVANAETPGYRARDLRSPSFDELVQGNAGSGIGTLRTNERHITGSVQGGSRFQVRRDTGVVTTPDGNRVNLEDEMLKVAQNQMDYQAVTGLYQRSLGLIRTALGKR